MDKDELIKTAYEKGCFYEKKYRGCAQCTVAALFDVLNIKNDTVFKAASGLASGGGLSCEGPCGGYSGGVMVMSMIIGRRFDFFEDDEDYKRTSFRMAKRLQEKFFDEYGTITCKEIHKKIFGRGYDLWNVDDKAQFELDGAHVDKCTNAVGLGASWSMEILLEELESRGLGVGDINSLIES